MMHSHLLLHSLVQGADLVVMILLAGGLVFRVLVLSTPSQRPSRFERCLPFLLLIIALADLTIRAQMITGRHGSELWPALPTVLLKTHFGSVWMARISLLGLLGFTSMFPKNERLGLAACALLLGTSSLSGHAADSGSLSLAVLLDWLHLLAVSAWVGGLLYLALLLRRWIASYKPEVDPLALITSVERFSTLAAASVAVILATGSYQIWQRVGSLAALLHTEYGQTLLVKLVLVLFLLVLGAFNRYVICPRFSRHSGGPATVLPAEAPRMLFKSVAIEIVLGSLIMVCVAILLQLPPARNEWESGYEASGHPTSHMDHGEAVPSELLPAEGASVKILSPREGQIFSGDEVPVRFNLVKGKRGGNLHIHVYVDGELMGMFTTVKGTLTGVQPGSHTMEARVVAEDHVTELDAKDTVKFTVRE
jgi:putative copper resistance protein D